MSGSQVRETIKRNRVYLWEVAKKLEVSEMTICRWLREEQMPEEKWHKLMNAIKEVLQERLASL